MRSIRGTIEGTAQAVDPFDRLRLDVKMDPLEQADVLVPAVAQALDVDHHRMRRSVLAVKEARRDDAKADRLVEG